MASMTLTLTVVAQNFDSIPSAIVHDTTYESSTTSAGNYQFKQPPGPGKVDTRSLPGATLKKVKSDEDYWYVDQAPPRNKKDRNSSTPGANQKGEREPESRSFTVFNLPWLNVIFWIILIAGFIALLAWFLSISNIRLFKKKSPQTEDEVEGEESENIFDMNFEKALQEAIAAKNYTLAVRLMYLQTLRNLSDRNLINYSHEKTNSDYLFQLAGSHYYKLFFLLEQVFPQLQEDSSFLLYLLQCLLQCTK